MTHELGILIIIAILISAPDARAASAQGARTADDYCDNQLQCAKNVCSSASDYMSNVTYDDLRDFTKSTYDSPTTTQSCRAEMQSETLLGTDAAHLLGDWPPLAQHGFSPVTPAAALARAAISFYKFVQEKNGSDLGQIEQFYINHGMAKTISEQSAAAALDRFDTRIGDLIRGVGRNSVWPGSTPGELKGIRASLANARSKILAQFGNPLGVKVQDLIQIARQYNTSEPNQSITPYDAKILLLYNLELSLKGQPNAEQTLKDFAESLHLKANFSPLDNDAHWKFMVPEDGYATGGSPHDITKMGEDWTGNGNVEPDLKSEVYGEGVDCTAFIQQLLKSLGYDIHSLYPNAPPLTTSHLRPLLRISENPRPLSQAATNLQPGDVIVINNDRGKERHALVVVGFEGNPPQPIMVDAMGNNERSIRFETHQLLDYSSGCPVFNPTESLFRGNAKVIRLRPDAPLKTN